MKIETTAHAAADAMCNFSYMQRYFIKNSAYTFGVQGLLSFLKSAMSQWFCLLVDLGREVFCGYFLGLNNV